MNCYYGYQQMNTVTSCEERSRMESVVCPKPRRLGLSNHSSINNHMRCPIRYIFLYFLSHFFVDFQSFFKIKIMTLFLFVPPQKKISYQSEIEDSGVGAELLDIILSKVISYFNIYIVIFQETK